MAIEHLLQAEGFVRLGRDHITLQTNIIGRLERQGLDATGARRLLATYLDMQKSHEAHRDRLRRELSEGP
ncbi:MAG TPA: hypothetical protein VKX28_27785 [Xanthobacteraceae bacterium]|nr:hypothetical protein [Xanthobacteraceae bacterium]